MFRLRDSAERRICFPQSAGSKAAARLRFENVGGSRGAGRRRHAADHPEEQESRIAEAMHGAVVRRSVGGVMKTALMIARAVGVAASLSADIVTLKNGTKIDGTVEAGGSQ